MLPVGGTRQEYFANTMSSTDPNVASQYTLEGQWWLLIGRVNAKYVTADGLFAMNTRLYYNRLFAGDTLYLAEDYFEDSFNNVHRFGFSDDGYFRGYISDVIFYNVGLVSFEA